LLRTRQDFVTINVVAFAFEMGVRVDEHGRSSLVVRWIVSGRASLPPTMRKGLATLLKPRAYRYIFQKAHQHRLAALG
jgi:hypothetical protein